MATSLFRSLRYLMIPQTRRFDQHWAYKAKIIKQRQEYVGEQPPISRASMSPWNYKSELFAFCKRFQENLDENLLKTALTSPSYIKKVEALEALQEAINQPDNTELSELGSSIISKAIRKLLRENFPTLPPEGIEAIHDFLTSDAILGRMSSTMGLKDIILSSQFPPSQEEFIRAFKAIVGCVAKSPQDNAEKRAELFVRDFLFVEMVGRNIEDIWEIPNPMAYLSRLLEKDGRPKPEPRLQRQTGVNTIWALYQVGIYSGKELLGEAPGETITTAVEMAAVDSIFRYFKIPTTAPVLNFDQD